MSAKAKLAENWRTGAIGAAIAVFGGTIFWVRPMEETSLSGIARLSYDVPFAFPPRVALTNSGVWVIYMDQPSHDEFGQKPEDQWSRALHAKLLNRLTRCGAKAVVFDIIFRPGSLTNQEDQVLAKAMRDNGRVVIGAEVTTTSSGASLTSIPVPPDEPFRSSVARYGFVNVPEDNDSGSRRHASDPRYPSLARKTAGFIGLKDSDPGAKQYINYYGPEGTVLGLGYNIALGDLMEDSFFKDKIFFIGKGQVMTAKGEKIDMHRTPPTRWTGKEWPGVEIQATILLNLLRRDWLNRLGYWTEFLVVLATGCLFGFGLVSARIGTAGVIAFVGSLGIALVAFFIWWHQRIWFSWLIPCAVQIPCALGWAVFSNAKRMSRENQTLQAALETAKGSEYPSPQRPAMAATGESSSASAPTLVDRDRRSQSAPLVPNYTLLRCVGRGAYGEVWLGRDLVSTLVAVKIIYRDRLPSDAPYEREFRGLQKFMPISRSHPGFVHVLHVGRNEEEGYFYYVMEVGDDEVSGQKIDPETYSARNLSNEIKRHKRFSPPECVAISLQLTAALEHLHQQQLIHRDIKPSNIIFVNNIPKFADIGLVTDIGQEVSTYGTPGYIGEGHGTPAGDVYSLGKVLYQVATGLDLAQFPEIPVSLVENSADLQFLQLNKIILKACEGDVTQRFKSAGEMHTSLLELQTRSKLA